jgi:hypothetical protein
MVCAAATFWLAADVALTCCCCADVLDAALLLLTLQVDSNQTCTMQGQ